MAANKGTELLTREECLEIIKNDWEQENVGNISLVDFKIIKCSTDLVGFMGEYYKMEVEAIEQPTQELRKGSYFIKSLPVENEVYRNECERKGFFTKESSIYNNILPNIQKYATKPLFPKAYLARRDILVLEDLTRAEKHLRHMQPQERYTLLHYQLFLQHLAELHAASLAWELKEDINISRTFKSCLFEMQLTSKNEWYTTGIKAILQLAKEHPQYQYPAAAEFIDHKLYNILLSIEDFTSPSQTLHNVFCHRDPWDRNIFWEMSASNEPVGCRIVDFQLSSYSPPGLDVLCFLYNNFEATAQRSQMLKDLLEFYYKSLRASLKRLHLPEDLITEEDFDQDCQRALLPTLVQQAICEPLLKLPEGWSQAVRDSEPETFDRYMNEDRYEMIRKVSEIDSTYMEKILLPIHDLMEYFGLKQK